MIVTTTHCLASGHPEFVLEADESIVPEVYLKNLAATLEEMVAEGSRFEPGETFQVGWMLTRVRPYDGDRLTLEEPDMETLPIRWVDGISQALRQQMLQIFLLDSVNLRHEALIPSILQTLIACDRFAEHEFFMNRSITSTERDSGWFVGCLDPGHDHNRPGNLCCMSLYEAYLRQRGILGFLMFPPGATVVMDRIHGVSIARDDGPLSVAEGSFLSAWLDSRDKDRDALRYPS